MTEFRFIFVLGTFRTGNNDHGRNPDAKKHRPRNFETATLFITYTYPSQQQRRGL